MNMYQKIQHLAQSKPNLSVTEFIDELNIPLKKTSFGQQLFENLDDDTPLFTEAEIAQNNQKGAEIREYLLTIETIFNHFTTYQDLCDSDPKSIKLKTFASKITQQNKDFGLQKKNNDTNKKK